MSDAHNDDVTLYYEVRGSDPRGPVVILIEGFTVQLVGWRPEFVDLLVEEGLRVVLMDNRDVGLSDKLPGRHYSVTDMAEDVVAVADALGVDRFHVVGQSMGGMIAQQVLASHPDRVQSLGLLYTSPAWEARWRRDPSAGQVGLEAASSRQEAIEASVQRERVSASSGYPFDEVWVRELAAAQYDRGYDPSGYPRQWDAMETFDRGAIPSITGTRIPSVIIQGTDDAYFLPSSAIELHRMLPDSELHLYAGMGHEMVRSLLPEYARAITRTIRAGARAAR